MTAELCHYGVKGMKWGIRRKQDRIPGNVKTAKSNLEKAKQARKSSSSATAKSKYKQAKKDYKQALNSDNKRYKKWDREQDKFLYGKGGVKRINRRMNKGDSYGMSVAKEIGRQSITGTLAAVGGMAAYGFIASGAAKQVGRKAVEEIYKQKGSAVRWMN